MEKNINDDNKQNVFLQLQPKELPEIVKNYYKSMHHVKMTFKILKDFNKQIDNLVLVMPPQTRLFQVKQKIDEISGKNFNFYLKNSFMPSLNSKIGDLAQCYSRFDERQMQYDISFTIVAVKEFFG